LGSDSLYYFPIKGREIMKRLKLTLIFLLGSIFFFTACDTGTGVSDIDTTDNFIGLTQVGGTSYAVTTTDLILTFNEDPTSLTINSIYVVGATKGDLTGTGTSRSLGISDITVDNRGSVAVIIYLGGAVMIQSAEVFRFLNVGEYYGGGKVAYILDSDDFGYIEDEQHGLIVATENQSNGIVWITGGSTISSDNGNTSTEIGTGQANTDAIITQAEAAENTDLTTYAAGLCDAYINEETGTGVYSDWYLPSIDELSELCTEQVVIAGDDGVGGFAGGLYWSSSEDDSDFAWLHYFNYSYNFNDLKINYGQVRAVRAF
jgi:hypothetical protein